MRDVFSDAGQVSIVTAGGIEWWLLNNLGEHQSWGNETGHLHCYHYSSGGRPLVKREPLVAEHGEGALDHDAGPAVHDSAHETGQSQHLA